MRRTFFIGGTLAIAVALGFVSGCNQDDKAPTGVKPTTETGNEGDHAGHEAGPRGGHIIDLGNGAYHAELTHDDNAKSVAIYLLDSTLKNAVAGDEREITLNLTVDGRPQQYKLPAVPQPGDPQGKSSRYEIVDETLVDAWDAPGGKGRLRVTIEGQSYSGDLDSDGHEHAGK